jgi:hypothetical protein
MRLIICPGFHDAALTTGFLAGIGDGGQAWNPVIIPSDRLPPYSGWHILHFLRDRLSRDDPDGMADPRLLLIGFSAGVVGAMTAAHLWQQQGGGVAALIAVDGWGVPLVGAFPIHRVSHDAFTHWSSVGLGQAGDSFYAAPGVAHLELWRSPQTTYGRQVSTAYIGLSSPTTAATFISALVRRYSDDYGCIA